jgi:hypothetical protein
VTWTCTALRLWFPPFAVEKVGNVPKAKKLFESQARS